MSGTEWRELQPDGWAAPKGYANGVSARGRTVFVAGQVGWNARGAFESDDFVAQVEQALANVVAVLGAGGASPEHLVRLTWYVTDKAAYVARRREIGSTIERKIRKREAPSIIADSSSSIGMLWKKSRISQTTIGRLTAT